ncbi:glycoside hydrolase family 38 C-terminal domain-containing protein [Paenibacillus sp. HB172176]|uniref:glycoside hydrolase family 38 N-terminal domain-containing protein n=1 Tax=Paenibacillus sp. HB172176 TaxID=2493690 RepID=UPI00143C76C3|nr:glycoside hydrolase family 38 C-terminal domain-containing protein [Paenibacillus sp. HB172176]
MKEKDIVHVIPFFHYDTVYLKSYETYLETALNHILEALRLMNEDSNYTFMVEQAILLEEFWERFPEKREELKRFASSGRLEVGSGMYCMPDLNLPSGEALIRNMEIGKRWVKETLGLEPNVFWVPDCFGHHPQMPQIAAHTGYTSYILGRVMEPDMMTPFYWRGADGTSMLCERIHGNYDILVFGKNGRWDREIQSWGDDALSGRIRSRYSFLKPVHLSRNILLPNGGDMAKPVRLSIEAVEAFNQSAADSKTGLSGVEARFSTLAEFVESVREEALELNTIEQDLNPPRMAGANSSRMRLKQANGRLSSLLQQMERLLAVIEWQEDSERMDRSRWTVLRDRLDRAWKLVTFGQFHDIIWGTILDEGYLDMLRRYREAEELLQRVGRELSAELSQPAAQAGNDAGAIGFTVFNPSAYDRSEDYATLFQLTEPGIRGASVTRVDGTPVPFEYEEIRSEDGGLTGARIIIRDCFPALSTVSYQLRWSKEVQPERELSLEQAAAIPLWSLQASGDGFVFENAHYRCEIQSSGCLSSYVSKSGDTREWVAEGQGWNDLLLLRDTGDLYNYYVYPGDKEVIDSTVDAWRVYSAGNTFGNSGALSVENETDSTITLLARGELNWWRVGVAYEKRITLHKHEARVSFATSLTGHGIQYRVVALFPTTLADSTFMQEIPFGHIKRPKKEFAAQQWSMLQEGGKSLLLVNRDIPGNGCHEGTMFLALTRSVTMDYKCVSETSYEKGERFEYHYEIMPHFSSAAQPVEELQPWRAGDRLNLPLVSWIDGEGRVSRQVQGPRMDGESIQLAGFYSRPEGWMLRFYEASGSPKRESLRLNRSQPVHVQESNGIGDTISTGQALPITETASRQSLEMEYGGFQIRTLLLADARQ